MSYGGIFDYATKKSTLASVNLELENPEVWNNQEKTQELNRQKKQLETIVNQIDILDGAIIDSSDLFQMARDENDESTILAVATDLNGLDTELSDLEFKRMFNHPMDPNN